MKTSRLMAALVLEGSALCLVLGCADSKARCPPGDFHKGRGEELLGGAASGMYAWDPRELPRNFSWRGPAERVNYDHRFTWRVYGEVRGDRNRPYEVQIDPRKAVFIFDGLDLGEGSYGWDALKWRLRCLPTGSVVLMYPDYFQRGQGLPPAVSIGPGIDFPFTFVELTELIIANELKLVCSSNPEYGWRPATQPEKTGKK